MDGTSEMRPSQTSGRQIGRIHLPQHRTCPIEDGRHVKRAVLAFSASRWACAENEKTPGNCAKSPGVAKLTAPPNSVVPEMQLSKMKFCLAGAVVR